MRTDSVRFPNIQALLLALGYAIDAPAEVFRCGAVAIPFHALRGHSVTTFVEKARGRGWLDPTPTAPVEQPEHDWAQWTF